jgi:hypothetical protein
VGREGVSEHATLTRFGAWFFDRQSRQIEWQSHRLQRLAQLSRLPVGVGHHDERRSNQDTGAGFSRDANRGSSAPGMIFLNVGVAVKLGVQSSVKHQYDGNPWP